LFGVRQIEIYIAEIISHVPSRLEIEIAIVKFKSYKSLGMGSNPGRIDSRRRWHISVCDPQTDYFHLE
jgi:hypothetical protein